MKERPTSVTIIGWYLVVAGLMSVLSLVTVLKNPAAQEMLQAAALPLTIQYLFTVTSVIVVMVNSWLLLKGNNAGRWLYVGWHLFSFALSMFNLSSKAVLIPGLIIFLLITFLLFRPNANAYFAKQPEEPMTHA